MSCGGMARISPPPSRRIHAFACRATAARLLRSLGIRGVVRGKKIITTNPDASQPCPPLGRFAVQIACRATDDKVNRRSKADRSNKPKGFGLYLCAALVGHR